MQLDKAILEGSRFCRLERNKVTDELAGSWMDFNRGLYINRLNNAWKNKNEKHEKRIMLLMHVIYPGGIIFEK